MARRKPAPGALARPVGLRQQLAAHYRAQADEPIRDPDLAPTLRTYRRWCARRAERLEAGAPFIGYGWQLGLEHPPARQGEYVLEPSGDLVPVHRETVDDQVRYRRPDGTLV